MVSHANYRKRWPQQKASVRRAIMVELASRGASLDDIEMLTGYGRKSIQVFICNTPEARFDGLRARRGRSMPVLREDVERYHALLASRKWNTEDAALECARLHEEIEVD